MSESFQRLQNARDAAGVLLALGFLSLGLSGGFLAYSLFEGFGIIGWFAYYVGPVALLPALPTIPLGYFFARKARGIRSEMDREDHS